MSRRALVSLGVLAAAAALGTPRGLRAAEYLPIYGLSFQGGQYFFAGERSQLNGNGSVNMAPVIKFSEALSLLPVYAGYYRGTKAVTDSVGAGTLFQQMMDHRVSLTGLYSDPDSTWKIKPSLSYKWEFLKETRDERWGGGLFDYEKAGFGFEAENVYKEPFSVRVGYDFYAIRFPNYVSLESKSGVDPSGNPLGRETAGARVLDTYNHQFSLSGSRPVPYEEPVVALQAAYTFLWQTFPDQPLINRQGQPNDHKPYERQDFNQNLTLSVSRPDTLGEGRVRVTSSWQSGAFYNGSNQNTFDAGQTQFVPDAYSYYGFNFGPSFQFSWGDVRKPYVAGASLVYTRTQYLGRLTQDVNGKYQDAHQHHNRYLLSLGYSYPIAPRFRLSANMNYLWATSNMRYEKTYKYTYNTANYTFGFAFDY